MRLQRPLERPAVRRACALALALLILLFAAQTWRKAHRPDGNDLTSYLSAARAVASGLDPYALPTPFPYIYPPFPALALVPLAALPYGVAVAVWYALSVAALATTFALFARRESRARRDADAVAVATLVVAVTIDVIQNNLLNGQINFLVLACCAGALVASRSGPAALAWAVAVATKILPLALAPWWILRRRTPVVAWTIVLVALLTLTPIAMTGTGVLLGYTRDFVAGALAYGAPADPLRFSLYGILDPIVPGVPWLPVACGLIVIGAAAAWDMRHRGVEGDHVAYALYLAAIPLASPKSETHHLAFALPAAYICALRMLRYRITLDDWRRRAVLASAGSFLIGDMFEKVRSGFWFAALILLCVTMGGLMVTGDAETREGAEE